MKRVKGTNNLFAIEYGEQSPLANHGSMEVAVDTETGHFFIHEVMLVTYGTDSVIKACESYG